MGQVVISDSDAARERIASSVSTWLRWRIRFAEFTQREFIARTGLPEGTVRKLISGEKAPSAVELFAIAKVLDVTIDEIFGEILKEERL